MRDEGGDGSRRGTRSINPGSQNLQGLSRILKDSVAALFIQRSVDVDGCAANAEPSIGNHLSESGATSCGTSWNMHAACRDSDVTLGTPDLLADLLHDCTIAMAAPVHDAHAVERALAALKGTTKRREMWRLMCHASRGQL